MVVIQHISNYILQLFHLKNSIFSLESENLFWKTFLFFHVTHQNYSVQNKDHSIRNGPYLYNDVYAFLYASPSSNENTASIILSPSSNMAHIL